MKKFFAILMVLVLALAMFTACTKKEEAPEATEAPAAAEEAATDAPAATDETATDAPAATDETATDAPAATDEATDADTAA